ncbi:MAG: DUF452 family protein [Muribaculaceae bacterium]|nr:DUF452 family protein [Muribaculaceae bacterium]
MESKIIYQSPDKTHRLILIFAGWSTTPSFYQGLHSDGWDIAVVWNYSSLELDTSFIDNYNTVFIIGWSLGVAAAAHAASTSLPPEKIGAAFAVNGTLLPSDDRFGIPCSIYEATRAGLNARNLLKFTGRMGYNPKDTINPEATGKEDISNSDYDELAHELEIIRDKASSGDLPWKRIYISEGDRIFPPENMIEFWTQHQSGAQIVTLKAPHYVNLQHIIDDITPDYSKIGDRFRNALSTYDDNAIAQRKIVKTLLSMIPEGAVAANGNLLEIGSGSGLLTYPLARRITPANATFIDLYPTPEFKVTSQETYITGDAEILINNFPDNHFDIIASASTIQWFADPENFFRQASRTLKKGGILLCSSFLPGNLSELDAARPTPLLYRSEQELRRMLTRYFSHVEITSHPITLKFSSRRQLMMHLKLTGVGGGRRSTEKPEFTLAATKPSEGARYSLSTRSADKGETTLTYLPVYIFASTPKK